MRGAAFITDTDVDAAINRAMVGLTPNRRRELNYAGAYALKSLTDATCLPRCLPQGDFCAEKIAEVPAAQEQHQKVSDLPPKADIEWHSANVRFVPEADIAECPTYVGLFLNSRHSLERWHTGLTLKATVYERGSKNDFTALARMPR